MELSSPHLHLDLSRHDVSTIEVSHRPEQPCGDPDCESPHDRTIYDVKVSTSCGEAITITLDAEAFASWAVFTNKYAMEHEAQKMMAVLDHINPT